MAFNNSDFENFFSQCYGARWEKIFSALKTKNKSVYRKNNFAQFDQFNTSIFKPFENIKNSFQEDENVNIHDLKDNQGMSLFYKMDPASQIVAETLAVEKSQRVLDMCAAPGGKTLILAEALQGTGELFCNEISKERRDRLMRVIHQYIPYELRQNTHVKGLDGSQFGLKMPDYFDAVLCDAPCSGERHLLENEKEFNQWTIKRSKNLAIRQFSLLSSAWLSCLAGGKIVYSTCSISPVENDEIIKKLIKRRSVEILRPDHLKKINFVESTEFGYQILPDTASFGPMFFSVLLKI